MSDKDKKYWFSQDHKKETPEYREDILKRSNKKQFKDGPDWSRRGFLGIMAASAAMAGLAGCRRPLEKIVPYVKQPEEVVPGVPSYYATSMPRGKSAYGLIVECHEGRPIKIEGNPDHPSTLGSSDSQIQASILNLYDPDRSRKCYRKGIEKSYDDFIAFSQEQHDKYKDSKGDGLAILTGEYSSPTISRLEKEYKKIFPRADWVVYEPVSDENFDKAIRQLTGQSARPIYKYDSAKVIVSFDADFLTNENESIRSARGFSDGRRLNSAEDSMNRLYVIESQFTVTGSMADHRLALRSGDIGQFIMALAKELTARGLKLDNIGSKALVDFDKNWMSALADDLIKNKSRSILTAGRRQPQWMHEIVLLINKALGNIGATIELIDYNDAGLSSIDDLGKLAEKIENGTVENLIILGGNPVYNAPADLKFDRLLKKLTHSLHLSEFVDETSAKSEWHITQANFLEGWGDTRAFDGTTGIIQPMIEPLYKGHTNIELLNLLVTGRDQRGYDIVRDIWKEIISGDFEKGWRKALHDGYYNESKLKAKSIRPNESKMSELEISSAMVLMSDKLEAVFYPSNIGDGYFANNGWLQELPDPISKLTWDNAAIMNQKTAKKLGLKSKDLIRLGDKNNEVTIPVWIVPGTADYSVGLALGYGRVDLGRVADEVGTNVYPLKRSTNFDILKNIKIDKTGEIYEMSNTQDHNSMEGRPIVREATHEEYKKHPEFAKEMVEHPPLESMYKDYDYSKGNQWGMVIDLNACIGCGACTIACQSENNIPIVGKEQVGNGREMHWMRLDRYFTGDEKNPEIVHMPVTCQHCENAPCESVCPVAATTHDKEGINGMAYNRCIGTRYCSNNCPYKVRKFNFFNYTKDLPETLKMVQNPDVTVRFRGVMEKCTFCIQRINRSKISAKNEGQPLKDGDVVTACQQACPTRAIQFGNIIDPGSDVAAGKAIDRNYELLAELNVRPRNSYLAKIRNPNPDIRKK